MCDYSLHAQASRPAVQGEELITSEFAGTRTRGFRAESDCDTAVCVRPGTEIAFKKDVRLDGWFTTKNLGASVAKFIKKDENAPTMHHDALELVDGSIVLVTELAVGQVLTIVQLPAPPIEHNEKEKPYVAEATDAA